MTQVALVRAVPAPRRGVVQVRLTGVDQSLYRAVYQLTEEPEGWRVQGVQLVKEAGIAV